MFTVSFQEVRARKFPKITVILLILDALEFIFVTHPINYMTPYLFQPEDEIDIAPHTFLKTQLISLLTGLFYLVGGWLADSYIGKYCMYTISMFIQTLMILPWLGAASVHYTFFQQSLRSILLLVGFILRAITRMGYGCVVALLAEQFNMPQDKDNLESYLLWRFWFHNIASCISNMALPYILSANFCSISSCYAFIFIFGVVVNVIYLLCLVRFKKLFKDSKLKQKSIEKSCVVICQAIKAKFFKPTVVTHLKKRKKQTCFDLIENENNIEVVANTKTALDIFRMIIPCGAYFSCDLYLGHLWHGLAYGMDVDFILFAVKPSLLRGIKYLFMIVLLPISLKVMYPLLRKFNLILSKMFCIGTAFFLVATCLVISTYIQIYTKRTAWRPLESDERYFTVYNTLEENCLVSTGKTVNRTIEPLQMIKIHEKYPLMEEIGIQIQCASKKIWNGNSSIQALSYIIMRNKAKDITVIGNPLPKLTMEFEPCVAFYCGIWPKCPDQKIEVLFEITNWYKMENIPEAGRMVKFCLPNVGQYKLNIAGINVPMRRFRSGGFYSFILYETKQKTNEVKRYEIISPNAVHVAWLIPQIFLAAIADVLAFVNIQLISYTQSPTKHRAFICAFREAVFIASDGALRSTITIQKMKQEIYYQYHVGMAVICFLICYISATFRYKMRTIYEEDVY